MVNDLLVKVLDEIIEMKKKIKKIKKKKKNERKMMKIMIDPYLYLFIMSQIIGHKKKGNQISFMHFDIMIGFLPKEKTTLTSLNN